MCIRDSWWVPAAQAGVHDGNSTTSPGRSSGSAIGHLGWGRRQAQPAGATSGRRRVVEAGQAAVVEQALEQRAPRGRDPRRRHHLGCATAFDRRQYEHRQGGHTGRPYGASLSDVIAEPGVTMLASSTRAAWPLAKS